MLGSIKLIGTLVKNRCIRDLIILRSLVWGIVLGKHCSRMLELRSDQWQNLRSAPFVEVSSRLSPLPKNVFIELRN